MIPRTLFLYWGGRKLSWLRYLTVVSFAKHNPDWEIKVYYPVVPAVSHTWKTKEQTIQYVGEDYTHKLTEYAELIPFDVETLGFSREMPEVHKSDVFRLWALHEHGGVYSDFDILYVKPMPRVKVRWYSRHPSEGHFSVGLLAAPKNDNLYAELLELARNSTGTTKYQVFGATLWHRVADDRLIEGWNIPTNFVYSCNWREAEKLFTSNEDLPPDAVGVHWFAGAMGEWESKLTPETYEGYDSTISNLIKEIV